MNYLSEMLKLPVVDAAGEKIGIVNDLGIATGEVFPRVTALAFQGPGKTPFMISWRKYVERFDDDGVYLKYPATDIRFSYLQPDEVLLARDIMNKQIVDTQGMKVVRVNDIKLSTTGENQLRLLGAEVGARGLLRAIHPLLERMSARVAKMLGKQLPEDIIAWSYMDLLERSTKQIKLSVSHKTLSELHPADIADIIEQGVLCMRSLVVAEHDARLKDLAFRDVVWVAPDLDQELVADEMTKYDLVAIPVCDENRHILGIVTVDDALDVIAEEHAEDLQIAGVSVGESNAGESTHAFTWFAQRQYWVVVWAIAACAIAAIVVTPLSNIDLTYQDMGIEGARDMITSQGLMALMPISIMPVVLMASMRMVSFVKNSYLEYDERDDEPKPYLGFFIKTTFIGVVLAGVVFLCGELMATTLFAEANPWAAKTLLGCFKSAAMVIAATYASAVVYFYILFRSDEKDQSVSGTSLTFAAVLLSALAYTILGSMPLL